MNCPKCKSSIDKNFFCKKCNKNYLKNNKIDFRLNEKKITDSFDKKKFFIKKYPRLYTLLVKLFSNVLIDNNLEKFIKKNISKNMISVNFGSGNFKIRKDIINLDVIDYQNTDVLYDGDELPFKDSSVDFLFNIAVLEHVSNPFEVINEFHRILSEDGILYCVIPFIFPYHASPEDYTRFTKSGIKTLLKDFEIITLKPSGGPASGFLGIFQEFLAILFSFNSKKLYNYIYLPICLLTSPIKIMDKFFLNHPCAEKITSSFLVICKKRRKIEKNTL